jgi:hypothetical protein
VLQHVVTRPDSTPHRAVKFGDALLLLMDTIVAVRAGTRLILFDPPVDPSVCDACAAAYAEAKATIMAAGGLMPWVESVGRRWATTA